jgi:hypothetical protein
MTLVPTLISGGEDWYNLFRDYWRHFADERLAAYMRRFRRKDLVETINKFLKGNVFRTLANVATEINTDGIPLAGAFNVAFLRAFYHSIFYLEITKFIGPIVEDGEFCKLENRVEFIENYGNLSHLGNTIKYFEAHISHKGDLGKRFDAARQDMSALAVRRRKLQILADEASGDAQNIIVQTRKSMLVLINMLNVIITRAPPGAYLGLTNFNDLVKKNEGLEEGIATGVSNLKEALQIMEAIDKVDNGK